MKSEKVWRKFCKTGSIESFLEYKKLQKEVKEEELGSKSKGDSN